MEITMTQCNELSECIALTLWGRQNYTITNLLLLHDWTRDNSELTFNDVKDFIIPYGIACRGQGSLDSTARVAQFPNISADAVITGAALILNGNLDATEIYTPTGGEKLGYIAIIDPATQRVPWDTLSVKIIM